MTHEHTIPDIWGFKIGYEYSPISDEVITIYAETPDFKIEIITVLETPDQIEFNAVDGDLSYLGKGDDAVLSKTYIHTSLGHVVSLKKLFTDIISQVVAQREIDLEEMDHAAAVEAEYARVTSSPYLTGRV